MWGVPNPGVADLASLLGCFEVSRTYFIATMDSFRTGGSRPFIPLELLDAFQ